MLVCRHARSSATHPDRKVAIQIALQRDLNMSRSKRDVKVVVQHSLQASFEGSPEILPTGDT